MSEAPAESHTHHTATHVAVKVVDFDNLLHRATAAEARIVEAMSYLATCHKTNCACCAGVRAQLTREMT